MPNPQSFGVSFENPLMELPGVKYMCVYFAVRSVLKVSVLIKHFFFLNTTPVKLRISSKSEPNRASLQRFHGDVLG